MNLDTTIESENGNQEQNQPPAAQPPAAQPQRAQRFARFPVKTMIQKENLLTDFDFKRQFRLSRVSFENLITQIGQFYPNGMSRNGGSVRPRERLLHFLHFLGSNELYRDAKVIRKMLHGKIFRFIRKVKPGKNSLPHL